MSKSFNKIIQENNETRDPSLLIFKQTYSSNFIENKEKIKACKSDNYKYSYIKIEKR